uniref:Aminotransferase-like plant mobile domain-containing protein n=1 Tax=Setaria viridis TaxID=4556 RepID=A0A4V6D6N0_SETVI|nr:hypothetical protein SEVIR_5G180900v2 [Setaria viridis]
MACLRYAIRMTRRSVVYDIHVKDYAVHRVMRQFGLYQDSPLPATASHQSGGGGGPGVLWAARMVQWVALWATALDEVIQDAGAHNADAFAAYLLWFLPRTRTRVLFILAKPPTEAAPVTQTYPRVRDINYDRAFNIIGDLDRQLMYGIEHFDVMNSLQHRSLLTRARDACRRFFSAVSCRGGHGHVFLPPRAPYPRWYVLSPARSSASSRDVLRHTTTTTTTTTILARHNKSVHRSAQRSAERLATCPADAIRMVLLSIFSCTGDTTSYAYQGWVSEDSHDEAAWSSGQAWFDDLFRVDPDLLGPSQLADAPQGPTQGSYTWATQYLTTPPAEGAGGCLTRDVHPPEPWMYDRQQTRAAQRAARHGHGAGEPHFKKGRI